MGVLDAPTVYYDGPPESRARLTHEAHLMLDFIKGPLGERIQNRTLERRFPDGTTIRVTSDHNSGVGTAIFTIKVPQEAPTVQRRGTVKEMRESDLATLFPVVMVSENHPSRGYVQRGALVCNYDDSGIDGIRYEVLFNKDWGANISPYYQAAEELLVPDIDADSDLEQLSQVGTRVWPSSYLQQWIWEGHSLIMRFDDVGLYISYDGVEEMLYEFLDQSAMATATRVGVVSWCGIFDYDGEPVFLFSYGPPLYVG